MIKLRTTSLGLTAISRFASASSNFSGWKPTERAVPSTEGLPLTWAKRDVRDGLLGAAAAAAAE